MENVKVDQYFEGIVKMSNLLPAKLPEDTWENPHDGDALLDWKVSTNMLNPFTFILNKGLMILG